MIFYLTVTNPAFLARTHVPLFVSRRGLSRYKRLPKAQGIWALDSGGYTELFTYGEWTVSPEQYVEEVRRFKSEIGNLQWAAIQDYMCEEWILAKTGKTVEEHQWLTVENYHRLRELGGPELADVWAPILQGQCFEDYLNHVRMYLITGVDLRQANTVGIGSVCRRQRQSDIGELFEELHRLGLKRMHAFGVKALGMSWSAQLTRAEDPRYEELFERAAERGFPPEILEQWLREAPDGGAVNWEEVSTIVCDLLYSADSNAWSYYARYHRNRVARTRDQLWGRGGWEERLGKIYVGGRFRGHVKHELAGAYDDPFAPTQMTEACSRQAAEGKRGKRHAACNNCLRWALRWRSDLLRELPLTCQEIVPSKRFLPAPDMSWRDRAIARAAELQEQALRDPYSLGEDYVAWLRSQGGQHGTRVP